MFRIGNVHICAWLHGAVSPCPLFKGSEGVLVVIWWLLLKFVEKWRECSVVVLVGKVNRHAKIVRGSGNARAMLASILDR